MLGVSATIKKYAILRTVSLIAMNLNIDRIANLTGFKPNIVDAVIRGLNAEIERSLRNGESVIISGFMVISFKDLPERFCRDPRNGNTITAKPSRRAYVKFSEKLQKAIQPDIFYETQNKKALKPKENSPFSAALITGKSLSDSATVTAPVLEKVTPQTESEDIV